jgi:hypothetical protein
MTDDDAYAELERGSVIGCSSSFTMSMRMGREKRGRYVSQQERVYISRLVEKYGDDVGKMARDVTLNFEQRTEGELRRGILRIT